MQFKDACLAQTALRKRTFANLDFTSDNVGSIIDFGASGIMEFEDFEEKEKAAKAAAANSAAAGKSQEGQENITER